MIDSQLASIGNTRQQRMERFRAACRKLWGELETPEEDRAAKEAEWVVADQTDLPSVIQNIHMEARAPSDLPLPPMLLCVSDLSIVTAVARSRCTHPARSSPLTWRLQMIRLEGDFMGMYLKTKSKLSKLSDKLNIPKKFLNPILLQVNNWNAISPTLAPQFIAV